MANHLRTTLALKTLWGCHKSAVTCCHFLPPQWMETSTLNKNQPTKGTTGTLAFSVHSSCREANLYEDFGTKGGGINPSLSMELQTSPGCASVLKIPSLFSFCPTPLLFPQDIYLSSALKNRH
uniref:Uncharacterized protein n=1 Tax=Sphaerodactylus townsendi TaxID=933632 RepID=A0ACB8E759_9SAUR